MRELKKCSISVMEDELPINIDILSADLTVSSQLVAWFIRFIHKQLLCDSNYQRRALSVQMYHETLTAFPTDTIKRSRKCKVQSCTSAVLFIEKVSVLDGWYASNFNNYFNACSMSDNFSELSANICEQSDESPPISEREPIVSLMLSETIPILINLLMDDMNDIREECEQIFDVITLCSWRNFASTFSKYPNCCKILNNITETDRRNIYFNTSSSKAIEKKYLSLSKSPQEADTSCLTIINNTSALDLDPSNKNDHVTRVGASVTATPSEGEAPLVQLQKPEPLVQLLQSMLLCAVLESRSNKASVAESAALLAKVTVSVVVKLQGNQYWLQQVCHLT